MATPLEICIGGAYFEKIDKRCGVNGALNCVL
jgi:hypothetical protein